MVASSLSITEVVGAGISIITRDISVDASSVRTCIECTDAVIAAVEWGVGASSVRANILSAVVSIVASNYRSGDASIVLAYLRFAKIGRWTFRLILGLS